MKTSIARQRLEHIRIDKEHYWFFLNFQILGFLIFHLSLNEHGMGYGLLGIAGVTVWQNPTEE